ncbi:Adenylate kinase [Crinalium epipsammum PCC 9333]|uniref:Adenylate kinase n=1 Tax=Crinalium epipsammum PCC 9333 TaxID=1173022 RepID=K9W5D1_9CYAN|nr:adenylate kinase [Crinalium epipsammum]AFZ15406.1 Adenylate kinase [Crinalium epipsammum PCC 9333]
MRLVILGGAGAGKGTQAQLLCSKLSIPWISTGNMLLSAIASQTPLGLQAKPYVDQGELVPDELMIEFMRQRLLQPDAQNGWFLDGYPRTAFQAEELNFLLDNLGQKLNKAIWLDVPESVMLTRSAQRGRLDDQPEIIQRRIALFNERTLPILEYYQPRQKLLQINGNQPPEQVHQDIWQKLFSST